MSAISHNRTLLAGGWGALVADDATGEVGEDRGQGRRSRALRHLSVGRGGSAP